MPRHLRFDVAERTLADGTIEQAVDIDEVEALAAGARRARHRGDRDLLPAQLRQPGQRAGGARGGRARRAGPARRDLQRRRARDPRVRAHADDGRERLRAGPRRALPGRPRGALSSPGRARPPARDALQRRRRHRAGRGRRGRSGCSSPAPPPARSRRARFAGAERLHGPDVVRHGRHDGQAVPDRGRPPARHARVRGRAHRPLHARLGPADQDADDRHDRDRRRRRVARARRHARAARLRAGVRGRRPRPGLLRRRRDAAHRDRRRPRARLPRPRVLPRRRHALDVEAAREAIREHIAEPLGLTVEEAAWGIHRLVNEDMASAARVHAAERGHDATGPAAVRVRRRRPGARVRRRRGARHHDRDRPRRGGRDEQRRRARRAARHRRACAAALEPVDDETLARMEPLFAELEARGRRDPALRRRRHHARALDRHALRRPGLRGHRPGRARRGPQGRVRGGVRALPRPQGPGRADRGHQLARPHARPGPRPAARRRSRPATATRGRARATCTSTTPTSRRPIYDRYRMGPGTRDRGPGDRRGARVHHASSARAPPPAWPRTAA